jgi:two-component system cell cycle sensor histidine kinase/response regulator CckA
MDDGPMSLLVKRASTINLTRMVILVGFLCATVIGHLVIVPVPTYVIVMFAVYVSLVIAYQPILRSLPTPRTVERLQIIAFVADTTLLSIVYVGLNAWWLSSTLHGLAAIGACASLPWRRARIVIGYATFAFVASLGAQALGMGPRLTFFGAPSLEGKYQLALVVAFLGLGQLIVAVYVQLTYIRITGRSEKRQQIVVESLRDWILTTDSVGRITSANEATLKVTGRSENEVIGQSFGNLLAPQSRDSADKLIQSTLAQHTNGILNARYLSASGSLNWIGCTALFLDGQNSSNAVLIVANDYTAQVESTEKHRIRDALLAETEQRVHLGTWEWDLETDTVECSEELCRIFRISPAKVLTSADFFAVAHPDDESSVRATFERSVQTGESFHYEHRIVVAPGEYAFVRVVARVVLDASGRPARLVGSVQDVTERNTLTEQLRQSQKMEAVGRLAGGIAHDFNNILTVIKSYSGFLIGALAEGTAARADAIEISMAADRAAALTKQLGIFSRREITDLQVVDLNERIEAVGQMLRRLVGENVRFEVCLEPKLWCVRVDPGQLDQILMNLVANARDASPAGGLLRIETANVVIEPTTTESGQDIEGGRFAMMSVCDTGMGMTEETQTRIFDPFFTTKDSGEGTGLGLSMVYGIVKQSGGQITVESSVGNGTTIRIYFPLVDEQATVVAAAAPFAGVRGGTETILLAEDQASVRKTTSRILRGAGYTVLEAENGKDASSQWEARTSAIDIVVTDMLMPTMGGRELASRIWKQKPRTPVLFMSGYTKDPIAVSAGTDVERFLGKPFTADSLLPLVRSMLDGAA